MLQPLDRFKGDGSDYQNQSYGVGQRCQVSGAIVAVGIARIGGPFSAYGSEPGKTKRKDVGQDMASVGEQRQRTCEKVWIALRALAQRL